ncbi:uncharacterized protein LOC144563044 [Carex rostrata]
MGKRKDSSNTAGNGKEEFLHWNTAMDGYLIDAFVHQNEIGNRVGGTFTSKAYDNVLSELSTVFPEKKIDKERIKNRIKYIKKGFGPCYDIFKNGLSGFSWDPLNSMWCAEPEVWDKLVEAHPNAASWRNRPVYHYEKLARLYGNDRATGEEAETPAEIRERERDLRQINHNICYIPKF